jgi:NitT/TauT family transport system ATP-binding protein
MGPRIVKSGPDEDFIRLDGVAKTYTTVNNTEVVALKPTSLTIAEGEFVSVVGPSGCGKTTLLNMLAGLIRRTEGDIWFRGRKIEGPRPDIAMVFQRPVLLPWRRVIDNVLLPVEVMKLQPAATYRKRAFELLEMVGLQGFENAYPQELSGGMQQRAAIARALVYESPLLLMDEPFAALDALTREDMNMELLRIWQLTRKSIVFVTHNISEAVLLSDRVIVMTARPGQVKEIIPIDIPRPRSLSLIGDPRFGAYTEGIRALFDETRRRKTADTEPQRRSQ